MGVTPHDSAADIRYRTLRKVFSTAADLPGTNATKQLRHLWCVCAVTDGWYQ